MWFGRHREFVPCCVANEYKVNTMADEEWAQNIMSNVWRWCVVRSTIQQKILSAIVCICRSSDYVHEWHTPYSNYYTAACTFHTNVHTNRPRQHVRARARRSGVIIITWQRNSDGAAWKKKLPYTQFRCGKMIVVTLRCAQSERVPFCFLHGWPSVNSIKQIRHMYLYKCVHVLSSRSNSILKRLRHGGMANN